MVAATKLASISLQVLACIGLVLAHTASTDEHATGKVSSELTNVGTVASVEQTATASSNSEQLKTGELVMFTRDDLTRLSREQHDFKDIPLGERCELFEETLREIFKDKSVESSIDSSRKLLERAIESLAARTSPYHGREQPYVRPLRECLELIDSISLDSVSSQPSPKRRVVVSGPNTSSQVAEVGKSPMDKVKDEFAQVKTRVVESSKDLYPPRSSIEVGSGESHHDGKFQPELHGAGSSDEPGHSSGAEEHSHESPHRAMNADVMRGIVHEVMAEEELEQLIDDEQDPVRKLQLELERERTRVQSLLKQLDENRNEIEALLEEKEQRTTQAGTIGDSRFEMMKSMYERASERERRTSARLAEVQKQLNDALGAHKTNDYYDDSRSDDESSPRKKAKNLAELAGKLRAQFSERDSLANRCQKYYMLRAYPEKANKKVVEVLTNLVFPSARLEAELFPVLAKFRSELAQVSSPSDGVVRELATCQSLNPRAPVYPPPSTSVAPATATVSNSGLGSSNHGHLAGDWNPQKLESVHHEINYKNGPHGFYHHEVHGNSPDSPLHVLKTKTKSSTSFSSGTKPATRLNVPVMGRDPTYGYRVVDRYMGP